MPRNGAGDEARPDRFEAKFDDQSAGVLSRRHLIQNKRAAGCDQDLVDMKWLVAGSSGPRWK